MKCGEQVRAEMRAGASPPSESPRGAREKNFGCCFCRAFIVRARHRAFANFVCISAHAHNNA